MATTLSEAESRRPEAERSAPPIGSQRPNVSELPNASELRDRTPHWLRAPRILFGFTAVLGGIYCFLNFRPLWHTDVWGHLSYGRLIWETGGLPATEPFMPLSSDIPFVDTAWLSQLIGYAAYCTVGAPAIQFLYAASITFCVGLLVWRFYNRTQNAILSLLGCPVFAWVNWQQLLIVRPQLAGLACFVSLLVLLTARRWSHVNWFAVPALFVLWANLHGSFPVGLAMLGCFCLGRGCDVLRRTRRFSSLFGDRQVRRYFLLGELAAVAVLMNPYGLGLYAEVLSISSNSNLADLVEWEPLHLRMRQGQAATAVALALILVCRMSPRRVSTSELLLLVGLGAGALWVSRMIVWWAPVAGYFLVLHSNSLWRRIRGERSEREPSPRSGMWAVVSVGFAWISFAYTPFGISLLHGNEQPLQASVSKSTPVGAVEYLKKHPSEGQVFNTYEWGDYLIWAGPRQIQVFVASHAHLVPEEVWQDYMHVINGASGWESTLDQYSVKTLVLNSVQQTMLINRLHKHEDWQVGYEDNQSVVFVRGKRG